MQPPIQFAVTSDGVRIAFMSGGEGPALIITPAWVSHLELDLHLTDARSFFRALSEGRHAIRYDGRGTGLSDREVQDMSIAGRARDIAAVRGRLTLKGFPQRFKLYEVVWQESSQGPRPRPSAATLEERGGNE